MLQSALVFKMHRFGVDLGLINVSLFLLFEGTFDRKREAKAASMGKSDAVS